MVAVVVVVVGGKVNGGSEGVVLLAQGSWEKSSGASLRSWSVNFWTGSITSMWLARGARRLRVMRPMPAPVSATWDLGWDRLAEVVSSEESEHGSHHWQCSCSSQKHNGFRCCGELVLFLAAMVGMELGHIPAA